MNAPLGSMPTKTELTAHQRRQAFRDKIASAAAALEASKNPAQISIEPEAMPAEPDPPRAPKVGSLGELLAWRREALRTLEGLDVLIGYAHVAGPSVFAIQEIVAKRYGISRNDICSARRTANITGPRLLAYYLAKELTPFSLVALGRFFGGRDHTTLLAGIRKVHRLCISNPEIAAEVQALAEIITGARQ